MLLNLTFIFAAELESTKKKKKKKKKRKKSLYGIIMKFDCSSSFDCIVYFLPTNILYK